MAIELIKTELLLIYAGQILAILVLSLILVPLKKYDMRRIPAIDHCLEALRVSAEKGTPLFMGPGKIDIGIMYSAGTGVVETSYVSSTLLLQKFLAKEACKYDTPLYVGTHQPMYVMMSRDFQQQGYIEGGHPELFNPENILYFPDGFTYSVGMVDNIHRVKPGGCIMIGHSTFWINNIIMEALNAEDVFVVGGELFPNDQAPNVVGADHMSIGEENIAIGAYLSEDPYQRSTLVAEDYVKWGIMGGTVLLTILLASGMVTL
jgi:hypothetical protein